MTDGSCAPRRGNRGPQLRILLVHAAVEWATADVGRGYLAALRKLGHEVFEFRTVNRLKYHGLALKSSPTPDAAEDMELVSRLACEGIVVEALRHRVDLVVVTAGGGIHPDGLELCNRTGTPVAVIFTESPYEDDPQAVFARHAGYVFTNDSWSARERGWRHLAAAYDPDVHRPYQRDPKQVCDVLIVGSGWPERQQFLEQIDWNGIDFRLYGFWPGIRPGSPLAPYYQGELLDDDASTSEMYALAPVIENAELARMYSSARVVINFHRRSEVAESLNPRAYEAAACGIFQISDWRAELDSVFGDTVPVYRDAGELGDLIRQVLGDERKRKARAAEQRSRILAGHHTFRDRAAELVSAVAGP